MRSGCRCGLGLSGCGNGVQQALKNAAGLVWLFERVEVERLADLNSGCEGRALRDAVIGGDGGGELAVGFVGVGECGECEWVLGLAHPSPGSDLDRATEISGRTATFAVTGSAICQK